MGKNHRQHEIMGKEFHSQLYQVGKMREKWLAQSSPVSHNTEGKCARQKAGQGSATLPASALAIGPGHTTAYGPGLI